MHATSPIAQTPGTDSTATVVHDDATALADRQPGRAAELVARPDPGREDDHVRGQIGAVGNRHRPGRTLRGRLDPGHLGRRQDVDIEAADQPRQGAAATLVDLQGHQPRCELDHLRRRTERPQRTGRLEPEQTAADHDTVDFLALGPQPLHVHPQRGDVVDGPVDEAPGRVAVLHRRHEGD